MADILHDAVEGPTKELLVLVVHGDDNGELGGPSEAGLAQGKVIVDEVVRIAGDSGVPAKQD